MTGDVLVAKGTIYFLTYEDAAFRELHPFIKIGKTTRPLCERLQELSTGTPVNLTVAGYIETDHLDKLESRLLKKLKHHRARGEWIHVDMDIIKYLKTNFEIKDDVLEAAFTPTINEDVIHLKKENFELKKKLKALHKKVSSLEYQIGELKGGRNKAATDKQQSRHDWKLWAESHAKQ